MHEIKTQWFEASFPDQPEYAYEESGVDAVKCRAHSWSAENSDEVGVYHIEVAELDPDAWAAVVAARRQDGFIRTMVAAKGDEVIQRFSRRGFFRRTSRPKKDLLVQRGGTLRRTLVLEHSVEGVSCEVMVLIASGEGGSILVAYASYADATSAEISSQFMRTLRLPQLDASETGLL